MGQINNIYVCLATHYWKNLAQFTELGAEAGFFQAYPVFPFCWPCFVSVCYNKPRTGVLHAAPGKPSCEAFTLGELQDPWHSLSSYVLLNLILLTAGSFPPGQYCFCVTDQVKYRVSFDIHVPTAIMSHLQWQSVKATWQECHWEDLKSIGLEDKVCKAFQKWYQTAQYVQKRFKWLSVGDTWKVHPSQFWGSNKGDRWLIPSGLEQKNVTVSEQRSKCLRESLKELVRDRAHEFLRRWTSSPSRPPGVSSVHCTCDTVPMLCLIPLSAAVLPLLFFTATR